MAALISKAAVISCEHKSYCDNEYNSVIIFLSSDMLLTANDINYILTKTKSCKKINHKHISIIIICICKIAYSKSYVSVSK